MEEVEGLTESSEETIHEHAHSGPKWASWVALSTALLAALAAISGSLSSHNETEAMLNRVAASNKWNYYQAKGNKGEVAEATNNMLLADGKPANPDLLDQIARDKDKQEKASEEATELDTESGIELKRHETFSYGVTLFQVAIAISAISILTKKRRYWGVSLVFGAGGLFFLIFGLLQYLKH